jgi:hypothetical protein
MFHFALIFIILSVGCDELKDDKKTTITEFTASPSRIRTGQTTTIRWKVTGAERFSLSGTTATSDSVVIVSPSKTTTYTLSAITKTGDSITRSITIAVAEDSAFATVRIDPNHFGPAIRSGFLGFSHEWGQAQLLMGDPAIGVNRIYRQLLRNLIAHGGGPLSIRIGGVSADRLGEPRHNTMTPLERLYDDMDSSVPGVSYLLGLNMAANDVALATRQASAIIGELPAGSVQALELGSRPDEYVANQFRQEGYDMDDYMYEWAGFTDTITESVPDCPLFMGPSNIAFAGDRQDVGSSGFGGTNRYRKFLRDHGRSIAIVSQHAFAKTGSACGGNLRPGALLDPGAALDHPREATPYISAARSAGKPYRVTEMNSVMCGGEKGISDAFEASLWLADILFEYAKSGMAGVNIHTNIWNPLTGWDAYGAFLFDVPERQYRAANVDRQPPQGYKFSSQYELKKVMPLYYGMLFFAEATANRARLLSVSHNSPPSLKVWATKDPVTGHVNVAIINKSTQVSGKILIRIPGYRSGQVKRMIAPSFSSTEGITLGGQTFDGSVDGLPVGTEYAETVEGSAGVFEISVGSASAALLTLVN